MAEFLEEVADRFRAAVLDDLDVPLARRPRVRKTLPAAGCEKAVEFLAELVEGFAQRTAPFLLPAPPHIAATIRSPALDPVDAAPGAVVVDLHLPFGRVEL